MIRVLIVDDDKLARDGLAKIIPWSKYNMQVVGQAANGRKALEFIAEGHVDLVFADIAMPVMDGLELIRTCKTEHPSVQFVVLSFHEDFEYVQEALRLGVIDYISKEQMGSGDYDAIIHRILGRMKPPVNDEENPASEANEEVTGSLKELTEGVIWVFDNLRYEEILGAIDNFAGSFKAAERILAAAVFRTEALLETGKLDITPAVNMETLKETLGNARDSFRKAIREDSSSKYSRLYTVAEYVWNNYAGSVNSKVIAENIGLSRSHFSIWFNKTMGMNFNQFVRRERMRNACRIMREEKLPQAVIAERVGYLDIKNYNAAFETVMKCSPVQYRRRLNINNGRE